MSQPVCRRESLGETGTKGEEEQKRGRGGWKQAIGTEKGWERRIQKEAWTEPWSIGPDSQTSLNQSERHL